MQKGQQTENQTCTKLEPGRLGTWMEMLNRYSGKMRWSSSPRGRGHDMVILRNKMNL
jgi:hypothetical protein